MGAVSLSTSNMVLMIDDEGCCSLGWSMSAVSFVPSKKLVIPGNASPIIPEDWSYAW